jgi:hypothetical protein
MLLNIANEVAEELETLAARQGSSVNEFLKAFLSRYAPEMDTATLADMAANARQAGIASAKPVDTSTRSREILQTEYADYLKRRLTPDNHDDHHG